MKLGTKYVIAALVAFAVFGTYSLYLNNNPQYHLEPTLRREANKPYATKKNRPNKNFARMTTEERNRFVAERCKEIKTWRDNAEPSNVTATMLIDHTYKLTVCSNLKVGSSTITHILYKMHNVTKIYQHKWRLSNLHCVLSPREINAFAYFSFMIVRDPLERLVSAYRDKRGVRLVNGKKVPFNTFLEDILSVDNYSHIDYHHVSFYDRCRPCEVEYDYFGTIETYSDDLRRILQHVDIDVNHIPKMNAKNTPDLMMKRMIRDVPVNVKRKLWKKYKHDYTLFGFPNPAIQSPSTRKKPYM